jgi:hypothetical protein
LLYYEFPLRSNESLNSESYTRKRRLNCFFSKLLRPQAF